MEKQYLVFDINNKAEEYVSVYEFCDKLMHKKENVQLPEELDNKVYIYLCDEMTENNPEKVFSLIDIKIRGNEMEVYNAACLKQAWGGEGYIRVAHDSEDATIEYVYLKALLYKFQKMRCLLYTESEKETEKYAVWSKAEEFFFGFSENGQSGYGQVYGEKRNFRDNIWQIEKMEGKKAEFRHAKVNPVIEINDRKQEIQFWRNSLRQHRMQGERYHERLKRVEKRCRGNFIEDYRNSAKSRENYYQEIYDSREFKQATQDMPLFAYYLFCMQIFYLKNGCCLEMDEIERIRLNAWDLTDGILQLMENVYHTTDKTGFLNIRVHENSKGNAYLKQRYGITDSDASFYYEIRLLDISEENIIESFQKRIENAADVEGLKVSSFFSDMQEDSVKEFWENYNQKEENLVHHYGLQIFSSIVSANEGFFKVISSSKYKYDCADETYSNRDCWESKDIEKAHLPGTEYIILLPLRGCEQRIITALEADMDYQYDMTTDFVVRECNIEEVQKEKSEYNNQSQKEKLINDLAEKLFLWEEDQLKAVKEKQKPVTFISMQDSMNYSMEIYCKALILCGIRQQKAGRKFYCMFYNCTENQILEIARIFAIFYCKAYLPAYMSDMQIYLVGREMELLITGSNINNLYAITSKIMLVKGINKETTKIMKYLLEQYGSAGNLEEGISGIKLVPFDMIELPGLSTTLFERNVAQTLNADMQKHSLGCRINETHMRIGSKIHIDSFFEAEILFHNNYYISRFVNLILKKLPSGDKNKLILVGYETYSELLLYKMVMELRNRGGQKGIPCQVSYMVYEQRLGGKFRYMEKECLESDKPLQFAVIIPINSTLTTHQKVRDALIEDLEEKGLTDEGKVQIIANYALILIRSSNQEECDELEKKFWESIRGNTIQTGLLPKGEPDVEFFISVHTKWYQPLKCPICFPDDFMKERPLIETDRTSIVPVQMIGMNDDDLFPKAVREKNSENLDRIRALKNSLVYKHVIRNGNHYLYYFCLEQYFIQERERIIEWLKAERCKRSTVKGRIVYDIIVSPLHYSNAGFVAEVNHYLFDNAALVLNFEVEKEFRENVRTKYSNIIGLYYNLLQIGKKALIRFHFVDDTIVSGRAFSRAKTIFQSLIHPQNEDVQIEVFSDVVIMLNRMSADSVENLMVKDMNRDKREEKMQHFHAYANLYISSMRNHEDACTECKLVTNFINLRNQSSTNMQYQFWDKQIKRHQPQEIQNKMQEELLANQSTGRERAYRRMICSHLANEKLGELGCEKNDSEKVRKVMIELMTEQKEDQLEWIISYVKIFSRPFICYLKSSREAIFQIMLWMTDYIVNEYRLKNKCNNSSHKEIREIGKCMAEQKEKSDSIICNLLLILMKRLSDLGSNYIIRKNNIINILKAVKKFNISSEEKRAFKERYIGIIKRICCQSNDENKSIFLEYLLLCGEEYKDIDNSAAKITDIHELIVMPHKNNAEEKEFFQLAFLENTRVWNDGIRDLARDFKKNQSKNADWENYLSDLLEQYYYENFRRLLYLYGYWKETLTQEGSRLLNIMVELYRHLEEKAEEGKEKDAQVYYNQLLRLLGRIAGIKNCYLVYGTAADDRMQSNQYYRIQESGNVESLKRTDAGIQTENLVADTFAPIYVVEENDTKKKRTYIKYNLQGTDNSVNNMILLQLDFSDELSERKIFICLKIIMAFHNKILQHLKQDFSNNMIQRWSAREYFNKQVRLQRATDHTDRDNLLKYYKQVLELYKYKGVSLEEEQKERDRSLLHMVINSYIARMNIQILAEANPEREPSHAAFREVYNKQLKLLIDSMHVVEKFRVLDENGEEKFSESLLARNVRLRKTENDESLSFRRVSVIVAELILSAINHSGKKGTADVYIYREKEYLVVKNPFQSTKQMQRIQKDIQDSLERKKDGISLAAIKETVNACYGLADHDGGVIIDTGLEKRKKYFYVKLPILSVWED